MTEDRSQKTEDRSQRVKEMKKKIIFIIIALILTFSFTKHFEIIFVDFRQLLKGRSNSIQGREKFYCLSTPSNIVFSQVTRRIRGIIDWEAVNRISGGILNETNTIVLPTQYGRILIGPAKFSEERVSRYSKEKREVIKWLVDSPEEISILWNYNGEYRKPTEIVKIDYFYGPGEPRRDIHEHIIYFGDNIWKYGIFFDTFGGLKYSSPSSLSFKPLIIDREIVVSTEVITSDFAERELTTTHPSEVFVIEGINSNQAIENLTELDEIPIEEIENKSLPGILCDSGYLGLGESLKQVLLYDNSYVLNKGYTHQQLAEWLSTVTSLDTSESRSPYFVYNGDLYQVFVSKRMGSVKTPFGNDSGLDVRIINFNTGQTIIFSKVLIEMIRKYGFYEGSVYYQNRLSPEEIIAMMEGENHTSPSYYKYVKLLFRQIGQSNSTLGRKLIKPYLTELPPESEEEFLENVNQERILELIEKEEEKWKLTGLYKDPDSGKILDINIIIKQNPETEKLELKGWRIVDKGAGKEIFIPKGYHWDLYLYGFSQELEKKYGITQQDLDEFFEGI